MDFMAKLFPATTGISNEIAANFHLPFPGFHYALRENDSP
jgi:hypothetical protein